MVFRKLESLSTQSSMSSGISKRSCFCSIVSSFGTNFADTLLKTKSAVKMVCTDPMLTPTSSASSQTVIRRSCMTKDRTWLMTLSFRLVEGLPWRGAAIFEAVVPIFYSCDIHGIIPEGLLNLSNSFHLGIAKLFAKLDAIPLLQSFRHFVITDNPTSVHNTYTVIDRMLATDAFDRREKIHACA